MLQLLALSFLPYKWPLSCSRFLSSENAKELLAQNSKLRNSHQEFMKHSPCRPLISKIALAAVALAGSLLSTSAHAALINGDFETGATDPANIIAGTGGNSGGADSSLIYTNSQITGNVPGWYTGGVNGSALATNDQTYFPLGPASNGPHGGSVALVLTSSGSPYDAFISQVTSAVAGTWYTVGYWVSTQGTTVPGPADNFLKVNWGATSISPSAIGGGTDYMPGAIPVPTGWTHLQFDVLSGGGGGERLTFIGAGAAGQEILLDDLTFVEAVPEVSSFGMLTGLGLLAFGTAARIRRRSLATA